MTAPAIADQITAATRTRATTQGDRFRLGTISSWPYAGYSHAKPSYLSGSVYKLACDIFEEFTRIAYFADSGHSLVIEAEVPFATLRTSIFRHDSRVAGGSWDRCLCDLFLHRRCENRALARFDHISISHWDGAMTTQSRSMSRRRVNSPTFLDRAIPRDSGKFSPALKGSF